MVCDMDSETLKINERKVVTKLVKYLKELMPYDIWYRTNYILRSAKAFSTQPEVDLLICRKERDEKYPPILAAEVKYIRTTRNGRIVPSYYSGLDEALALLILGFDKVVLIHLVEEEILSKIFLHYAKILSDTIKRLNLPLGYRVYSLTSLGDVRFCRTVRLKSGSIYNLKNLWVLPPLNPLLRDNSDLGSVVRKNRKALVNALGVRDKGSHRAL